MASENKNFIQNILDYLTKDYEADKHITPRLWEGNYRSELCEGSRNMADLSINPPALHNASETHQEVLKLLDREILQPWLRYRHLILDLPILTIKEIIDCVDKYYRDNIFDIHERYDGLSEHKKMDKLRKFVRNLTNHDDFFFDDDTIDGLGYLNTSQKTYIKESRKALKEARYEIYKLQKEIHNHFCEVMRCNTLSDVKQNETRKLYKEKWEACETRIKNILESARKVLRDRGEPYAN